MAAIGKGLQPKLKRSALTATSRDCAVEGAQGNALSGPVARHLELVEPTARPS